ncbi:uncharacterized protein LOC135100976 [Scylla paramamosain]|uniref:uncharacterized protein LOC135100976 n=1 Tax=Scylla paramamosain TaxID=85552 RepID=UPI003083B8C3
MTSLWMKASRLQRLWSHLRRHGLVCKPPEHVHDGTRVLDDEITDPGLLAMLTEILGHVKKSDPARGRWDVIGDEATLWADASALALGAVLEVNGEVIEDACWLRCNECSHINLAELDVAIRGLNLAVSWNMKKLALMTDSRTVFHWLQDTLSGKARLKTKASFKAVTEEFNLRHEVKFVSSIKNRADELTLVPKKWMSLANDYVLCTAVAAVSDQDIATIHETSGHPRIRRTLFFCRRLHPDVQREQVRNVVQHCRECQSIDPAPTKWRKGELGITNIWNRVSMDICHARNQHYQTLIGCEPRCYAIWRRLRRQDAICVIEHLESVFYERGALQELLTNNAASFRISVFHDFASRWGMAVRYRCTNVPSGDRVWIRHPSRRCNSRSLKGMVTRIVSAQNVTIIPSPKTPMAPQHRHNPNHKMAASQPRPTPQRYITDTIHQPNFSGQELLVPQRTQQPDPGY